jgi:arylsulfatase A-like enzyme
MNKPRNIVFLHVDQLMTNVLKTYGKTGINKPAAFTHTPGIEHIASKGHTFINSYCTGPQCVPSRSSWFTGRTVAETGVLRNNYIMVEKYPDVGAWLRDKAGFLTLYAGKWHVSRLKVNDSFKVLDPGSPQGESTDAGVGRSAMAFLNNYNGEKPFFLSIGLLNPHDCCYIHQQMGKYGLSDQIKDKDSKNLPPPLPDNFHMKKKKKKEGKKTSNWSEAEWRYYLYQYSRQTEMIDSITFRIWETLRASKFADNTLFIFSADHGEGGAHKGTVSKGYLDDNTMRVPLIFEWPGVEKPGKVDYTHLVTGTDLVPTLCDFAGCSPLPGVVIGQSLRPLLADNKIPWRDYVVCESGKGKFGASVVSKSHQCNFFADGSWQLYDRTADPFQMKNLAKKDTGKKIKKTHLASLQDYIGKIKLHQEGGSATKKATDH